SFFDPCLRTLPLLLSFPTRRSSDLSIRLYHPNPEKIGYPMQFTKQGALEKGESYFITGKGSMGMAMRAKTPIFDDDGKVIGVVRSEEHTSELQSRFDLVCRLLLEKK